MAYRTTPASNPFLEISGGDLVGDNLLNTSSGGWTFAMGLNRNGIGSWQCLCLQHDTSAEKLFLAEFNPSNQVVVGDEFGSVNSTFTVTEQTADIIIAVSWDGTDNIAGNMRLSYFNGTSWTHNTVTWNSSQAAVAMQSAWRFKLMNNLSNGDDLNADVYAAGLRLGGRSQAEIEALSLGSGGYATWQTMFDIADAWLHKFDDISSRTDDANGTANETSRSAAGLAFQADPSGFFGGGSSPVSGSDSGTATDTASLQRQSTATDSAAATDTAQVAQSKGATDSAAVTDTAAVTQHKTASDQGTFTDDDVTVSGGSDEQGTFTDTAAVQRQSGATDSATVADSAQGSASAIRTDSVAVTDSASVSGSGTPSGNDTGTVTDTATVNTGADGEQMVALGQARTATFITVGVTGALFEQATAAAGFEQPEASAEFLIAETELILA